MIERKKIPEPLLQDLINLFDEEKTKIIAKNVGYSYHALVWKVIDEKFRRKFGVRLQLLFAGVVIVLFIIFYYVKTRY